MSAINTYNFVARLGAASQTTQKILLYAYENAIPVITCSGGDISISAWVAVGTDEAGKYPIGSSDTTDRACYCAVATITGLAANTGYSWSASQSGSNKNWSGDFTTLLSIGDNETFSFITWTCDTFGDGSDACLQYIEDHINDEGGIRFLIKQDDVGYYDDRDVRDAIGLSGMDASGDPETVVTEFNYAMSMMCYHSMTTDLGMPLGVRQRLWTKLPTFEMWGDHELANNYMQNTVGATHDLTHYKMCRPVWDGFHANGMPDTLASVQFNRGQVSPSVVEVTLQDSLHFGVECGQFAWTQMDRNSHACYDATYIANNAAASPAPTAGLLGGGSGYGGQSNDLRKFLRVSSAQFKLWASSNSIQRVQSGTGDGGQEPWKDPSLDPDWVAEWQRWVDWIEGNDSVNGTDGVLVCYRGNDHNQQVFSHVMTATNTNTVDMVELVAGPVTHVGNHPTAPIGNIFNAITCEWTNEADATTHHQGMIHWTVYGATKMRARMVNEFGNVIWEADFFPGSNNFVLPEQKVGGAGSF